MSLWNYSELEAVTKEYFLPTVVDQIFSKDAILNKIREKKKTVAGGRAFTVNIKVDTLNRGKFAADSSFDVTKQEIINRLDMPVRGHYANLTIDSFEEAQNSGNAAIVNLVSEKMEDLEEAMRQELLDALYGDPAIVDPTNKGFQGLQHIVSDKNVFGGVDRSQADRAYLRSIVEEDLSGTAPIVLDYTKLREFYMSVTDGGSDGRGLVFVGDFSTINQIEKILHDKNQITTVKETEANLGFENFTIFGKPCFASSKLEEQAKSTGKGVLYALNFDYLTMHTLKGQDFRMTEFKKDRNTELRSAQLLVAGNFVATKPKRLGVIKDIQI